MRFGVVSEVCKGNLDDGDEKQKKREATKCVAWVFGSEEMILLERLQKSADGT